MIIAHHNTAQSHVCFPGFYCFDFYFEKIKEVCPIIPLEKLTQPSVSTNYSFVCFAVSQSRNLMFFPLRLGSGLPTLDQYFLWLKVVTSGWPSALHMTFLSPAVSRCWSKPLFASSWQPNSDLESCPV